MSSRSDALYYMRKNLCPEIKFAIEDDVLTVVTDYPLSISFSIKHSRASGGVGYKYLIILSHLIDVTKPLVINSVSELSDYINANVGIHCCLFMLSSFKKRGVE